MTLAPSRVLLIKPSSFGDIVQSLPVLAALKRAWPDAAIDWAIKRQWAELIEDHPLLHRVMPFPGAVSDVWRCGMSLRRQKYELVIDLQGLLRSALCAMMTGCSTRAGFADSREGSSWCYSHRVVVSAGLIHAVDRYLDLVRQLGVATDRNVTFPLPERFNERDWADRLWARENLEPSQTIGVLHPTARWKTKRWPAERFARLADQLSEDGVRVILVGGSAEVDVTNEVRRQMKHDAVNLGGATTLRQLAALLRRANLLVTNDSGPMHLAAALGTPVVALFGPTDPRRVGPYGAGHLVLRKGVDCSRCSRDRCARDGACMRAIEVDEVAAAVRKTARAAGAKHAWGPPAEL